MAIERLPSLPTLPPQERRALEQYLLRQDLRIAALEAQAQRRLQVERCIYRVPAATSSFALTDVLGPRQRPDIVLLTLDNQTGVGRRISAIHGFGKGVLPPLLVVQNLSNSTVTLDTFVGEHLTTPESCFRSSVSLSPGTGAILVQSLPGDPLPQVTTLGWRLVS
jgi:hypothetical protein